VRLSAILLVLAVIPAPALSADLYGAIAYSPSKKAHGWANDFSTRAAAEKAALSGCAKLADDCRPVLWFKNACGALALGPTGQGWEWGDDQPMADRRAINACAKDSKACIVTRRFCTADKRPSESPKKDARKKNK
jgi:hypothetical protein